MQSTPPHLPFLEIYSKQEVESDLIACSIDQASIDLELLIQQKLSIESQALKSQKDLKLLKSLNQKLKRFSNPSSSLTLPLIPPVPPQLPAPESCLISSKYRITAEALSNLLDYQKLGLEWLYSIHEKGTGGLLGDEMGLGKTVMVTVFLEGLRNSMLISGPVVILCPATLIAQWEAEIHKWAPAFVVYTFKNNRKGVMKALFQEPFGILLITYEILHTEYELLHSRKWFYVILDEGHKIKNSNCLLTQLCKRFHSFHRLLLSGTPIQNSLMELWSLFDFISPGMLGDLEVFEREFGTPITKAGYSKASETEVELAYQCALQLRNIISPYILRRTKKDVNIGIPDHQEKILYCELDMCQWEVYTKYLDMLMMNNSKKTDVDNFVWIKDLRYICNHPAMLEDSMLSRLGLERSGLSSGKLSILESVLDIWTNEGHSVLVFSQYKKMLSLTEEILTRSGIIYDRIDGDLEISKRLPAIDRFNRGELQVLLLTTKVGGLGINLPKASRVILLDPDWNPMNDSQAKERALRIGQKETLVIYRFITRHTIEEKIYNRQIFKLFLANKVRVM